MFKGKEGTAELQNGQTEKIIHFFTLFVVIFAGAYAIVPMLLYQENYVFTIFDGLDSYTGMVQMIHEKGLYFKMNSCLSIMNDMPAKYLCLTYNIYDFLNCMLGYVNGQICTRILGVCIGFFSMKYLMKELFPVENGIQQDLISLLSITYTITPCAPNRTIAFAALPMGILLFIYLAKEDKFTFLTFIALFYPFFSAFASVLVFVVGGWFIGTLIVWIRQRKMNLNLWTAFIFLCISTVVVNINYFLIALGAEESNRSLLRSTYHDWEWDTYKDYLLNGINHSRPLHGYILLPFLVLGTVYIFFRHKKYVNNKKDTNLNRGIIAMGWVAWIFSAFVLTFQDAGFSTGILLIDGFSWGRLAGLMRLMWYLMFGCLAFSAPESTFRREKKGMLQGLMIACLVLLVLFIVFQSVGYPAGLTYINGLWIKKLISILRIILYMFFGVLLFYSTSKKLFYSVIYGVVLLQLSFVATAFTDYNDVPNTLIHDILNYGDDWSICMKEFFSEELFEEIKSDIDYQNERVVAYGYHPSVLTYNGFNTLDGYVSVHSMEYQLEFREVIAPALDRYEKYANYYDGWGGRMYLYGELSFEPTREKNVPPTPLYINTDALKKLDGKYILSRARISNAEELGLTLVKDYDREDSLYHIFLYEI